jgi:predicted acylesterase/phospholipase RssA
VRIVLVLLLMSLCACASVTPNARVSCDLEIKDYAFRPYAPLAAAKAKPGEYSVLALSAGGEYGAYGAGFLQGWAQAEGGSRRHIDSVTGVSAGALLATHAFLDRDDELARLLSTLGNEDLVKERFPLALLWADSIYDSSPKAALIARVMPDDLIARVPPYADERHRGLYIGIVDLSSGDFYAVDMVKLARRGDREGYDCFRAVLNASSAIPIAFSPQVMKDGSYVDGGARSYLFLYRLALDQGANFEERKVYAIVNGNLSVTPENPPHKLLPILQRTFEVTTDQLQKSAVIGIDYAAKVLAPKPFDTYYAAAAQATQACRAKAADAIKAECAPGGWMGAAPLFCTPFMRCLVEEGREEGLRQAWKRTPQEIGIAPSLRQAQ